MLQDNVFVRSEADRWFERNHEALEQFDVAADLPLKLMDLYALRPVRVLEIGAASGFRLAAIHARSGASVVAVEPSRRAITHGKANFSCVHFIQGSAISVPLRKSFDLVIVNFVLHWIDRGNLFRALAEVDRLVKDQGYLLIGDFQPSNCLRVPYHHLPKESVYTYKQNYAAGFLASGLYHPVAMLSGDHASKQLQPAVAESERIGAWLLRKETQIQYNGGGQGGHGR